MRVRWVHAKRSALYILQRPNIHLGGEEVAHRHQPAERINKFAGFDFFYSFEQEFSRHGGAGQADGFQNGNFTAAQLDLVSHVAILTANRAVSSELFGQALLRVFFQPIPEHVQPIADFSFRSRQFLPR